MIAVHLDTHELDRISAELGIKRDAVVRRFAFEVEAMAKMLAPYDTGAMSNSIYTHTKGHDGWGAAASNALARNPKAEVEPIPEPEGDVLATVGPCVNYAIFVELGTGKMAAQPFLTPAVEMKTAEFNSGRTWEEIVR